MKILHIIDHIGIGNLVYNSDKGFVVLDFTTEEGIYFEETKLENLEEEIFNILQGFLPLGYGPEDANLILEKVREAMQEEDSKLKRWL